MWFHLLVVGVIFLIEAAWRFTLYARNDDLRIFYEVIGSGPPVVLLHGFGETGRSWRAKGLVDALSPEFSLILIDARGHGDSDKPHDPAAYALELLVADVLAVLDASQVERCSVLGYSQGGWIALGLATLARHRIENLAIGGATPYGQDLTPYRQLCSLGLPAALSALEVSAHLQLPPDVREAFLANDVAALAAAYANDRPDISGSLAGLRIPCLFFAGEADPLLADMQRLAAAIAGARFVGMPGLNHVQGALRIGMLASEFQRFLSLRD